MSRSRSRLAADWFAKLRINAQTQEVEHEDVSDVKEEVDTSVASEMAALDSDKADLSYVDTTAQQLEAEIAAVEETMNNTHKGLKSQRVFTSSGTWTKPAGINTIKVYVTGGGGGGGAGYNTYNHGGGGGAGGTAIKIIDVSNVSSVAVTIGGAGTKGSGDGSPGATGGVSSFGTYCSASGGRGGCSLDTGTWENYGGNGSGGDINIYGGNGCGWGGGVTDNTAAANGGASFWGGGGQSLNQNDTGTNARCYGAGGGPGDDNNTSDRTGGNGKPGVVVVEEYA